jgi:hypothetical protein
MMSDTPSWTSGLSCVKKFVTKHGHARIPRQYISPDGHRTGQWVAHRRRDYAAGRLSAERIAELESVPGWTWDVLDQKWANGIAAVRAFSTEHGHARIPHSYVSPDGHRTGQWVSHRRRDYAAGRLTAERIVELEAVPGWAWGALDQKWAEGIAAVRAFSDQHGHAKVSQEYRAPDRHRTGMWVSNRRRAYTAGRLSGDRIADLEAVPGWTWLEKETLWDDGVEAVKRFAAGHRHARVPYRYISPDGHPTGHWVNSRRTEYAKGKLDAERIAELEAIPGWAWGDRARLWDDGVAAVKRFSDEHGHARVPSRYTSPDGHPTGQWASNRRGEYVKGKLTSERIAELEAIPGWVWDTRQGKR